VVRGLVVAVGCRLRGEVWEVSWMVGDPVSGENVPEVTVEDVGGGIGVVRVSGEVDMLTAPELAELLRSQIEAGCRAVVVDLSRTAFLGSSGLAALVEAERLARARTRLVLAGPVNHIVGRALELTGLDGRFGRYAGVDEALAALRADTVR
jgi:anti-sigma B factor antagonist